MTEADWLNSLYPYRLLSHLAQSQTLSDRKTRLLAVACCRRVAEWLPDLVLSEVIDACEQCAEEPEAYERLFALNRTMSDYGERAREAAGDVDLEFYEFISAVTALTEWPSVGLDCFEWCRDALCGHDDFVAGLGETLFQIDLLRDIFGNPFRSVTFDPSWRTSTVVTLAEQMYGARDFAPMPVLADALQDAGCDNEDILAHCRGDGPHVRGCWVVDLILGKS